MSHVSGVHFKSYFVISLESDLMLKVVPQVGPNLYKRALKWLQVPVLNLNWLVSMHVVYNWRLMKQCSYMHTDLLHAYQNPPTTL